MAAMVMGVMEEVWLAMAVAGHWIIRVTTRAATEASESRRLRRRILIRLSF
jgi:hypothetical protein